MVDDLIDSSDAVLVALEDAAAGAATASFHFYGHRPSTYICCDVSNLVASEWVQQQQQQ